MRLLGLFMLSLALGCSGTVYLGDNRRDVPVDTPAEPPDAPPGMDAAPDRTAPPDAKADVADAATDGAADAAPDAPEPTACERYTRARVVEVGGPAAVFDTEPARLPDVSCAVARSGAYLVTRVALRERAIVRVRHLTLRPVAIRRACDEPSTEVACGRSLAPQVLEPGTYYVLAEIDPSDLNRGVTITASPVTPSGLEGNTRCEGATDLAALAPNTSESLALTTEPRPGCLPFETGPARYYKATVAPGRRLVVTAGQAGLPSPESLSPATTLFGATVRIFPSCAATSCLAAASAGPGFAASAGWTNPGASPVEVFVAVAALAGPSASGVTVSSVTLAPAPGERCDAPDELRPGVTTTVDLSAAAERPAPCGDERYPLTAARFLRVRVPARHTLDVFASAIPTGGLTRPWLRLYERCGDTACLGDRWSWQTWSPSATLAWANESAVDRDLVLAVGAQVGRAGEPPVPVLLDAAVRPIGAGQRCDAPIELPVDGSATALSTEGSSVLLPRCDAGAQPGAARFVRLTIPARHGVSLNVNGGAGGPLSYRWRQLDGCALTCATVSSTPSYLNPTDAPRTLLLALAAEPLGSTYRLRVSATVHPIRPETDCAAAPLLPLGMNHVPASMFAAAPSPCTGVEQPSFFRVVVPPRHVLRARALGYGSLGLLDRCGAECLPGSPQITFSDRTLQVLGAWTSNPTDAPREVVVAVPNAFAAAGGTTPVLLEATPLARNATCADATTLTPGVDLLHEDAAGGGAAATGGDRDTAASVFYRVSVPAGRRVTFEVRRPADARGPWLARETLLRACGALIHNLRGPALSWVNRGAAAQDVYLAVATSAGHDGRFELAARLSDPAPAVACADAPALADGAELRDLELPETTGFTLTLNEPQVFYRATIPPGQSLVLTSTAPLYALFAASCASAVAQPAADGARTYLRANTTASPQDVIVGLRSGTSAAVRATVRAAIAAPAHAVEPIAGGCDALTDAPLVTGDEATSAVRPLPFAFTYFGEAVRGYSVSTNGYLQLWPDAAGAPAQFTRPSTVPLPVGDAPPRLVAPFWEDLLPSTAAAGVRAALFEAPRRHLTVEWRDLREWRSLFSESHFRTFQAWLYEDGVIEFRYCRSGVTEAGPRVAFGLQGATAARWTTWLRPGGGGDPVSTHGGLRFTPR